MKNFTKQNFKTNPLWIRLLIMTFVLLLGSSAWGKTLYLNPKWDNDTWDKDGAWFQAWAWKSGENGNWYTAYSVDEGYYAFDIPDNTTHVKLYRKAKDGASNDHNNGNWGSTGDIELGSNDLCKMRDYSNVNLYSTTKSYELSGGFSSNNNWQSTVFPSNISMQANNTPYEFKVKEIVKYNDNGDKTFEVWLSNSGTMDRNNHEGWTMYADVSQNCKITADISGTYTFTFDATTKKLSVEYPSACSTPELSDFTYTLPDDDNTKAGNEVMWNGNTHAATVKWKDEDSTEGITIYYKNGDVYSEEAPSAVGEYEVYITTTENNDFCALTTKTEVGTFTITCPAPAEVPKFEVTQHEVVCGNTNIQKGIIKITNPVANYKYRLGNEGYTEYTLDANNSIPGIDGGAKYRISAVRYCGTAKSSTTNEEEYAEISKTDVKLTPTLTSTPIVKCGEGDNAYTPGTLVITNYNEDYNYAITPGVGTPTIDGTNATYSINAKIDTEYTVIATHKEYNCSSVQAKTTVAITNNTPTLEEISISSNVQIVCAGDNNVTLTCNLVNPVGTPSYKWFKNGVEIVGETSNLIPAGTLNENTTFSVAVILDNNGCTKEFNAEKLIEVKVRPEAPNLGAEGTAICKGATVDLPMVDQNNNSNQINWYNGNKVNPTNLSVPETTTFYAEAVSENGLGCPSNDKTPYTVTVNPLPEIGSISGATSAVKYEDVELRANGVTEGATVKWYEGGVEKATGATYVVTSEIATSKTVTAKAFLNGCESEKTHKVTFGNEVCQKIESKDIEITFKHPNKNSNDVACQYWGFGYIFKKGVTPNNNNSNYLAVFPNKEETSGSKTVTLSNIQSSTIEIYLKAFYQYGGCTASTKIITLTRGKKYEITISSDEQGNGNWEKEATVTEKGSLPQDQKITAPAVKMVSVEYDEVNDKIVAKGAVYKTGCGETFWGFQYSTDGQTWGTTNEYFIHPSGNSLSVPGEFEYSFAIPNAGGGDIYYIRAYALNNYNGSYALSNAVYSATSLPVEIPSKTIESATISLVDSEGKPSDATVVCPQSTVYLKVSYVGGDFKEYEAADNFPGANLELVNHDKVNNYATFSFTATAAGTANITISNNSGSTVTPADGVSITLKDVQVDAPYISIDPASGIICEGSSATIKVENNPSPDCSYKLVKEGSEEEFPPYDSGDLTYTVQDVGKYYVIARHNECTAYEYTSNQVAINQIISTSAKISIKPTSAETTPWEKVSIEVIYDEGYGYDLTYPNGLDNVENVIIEQVGDTYTYSIPRPWTTGDANPRRASISYQIKAKLKVDGEATQCNNMSEASTTITLKDEDNENCPK